MSVSFLFTYFWNESFPYTKCIPEPGKKKKITALGKMSLFLLGAGLTDTGTCHVSFPGCHCSTAVPSCFLGTQRRSPLPFSPELEVVPSFPFPHLV